MMRGTLVADIPCCMRHFSVVLSCQGCRVGERVPDDAQALLFAHMCSNSRFLREVLRRRVDNTHFFRRLNPLILGRSHLCGAIGLFVRPWVTESVFSRLNPSIPWVPACFMMRMHFVGEGNVV